MPAKPATAKQLSYLKVLADRTGQTFTYPKTASQASLEIQRLRCARSDSSADRRRERKEIADAIQAGPDNAAARVRADEVDGHGGRATWVQNRPQDPPAAPEPRAAHRRTVGPRRELGRYTAAGEQRIVWGQRVNGVVRVTDCPANERGRRYLIERELQSNAELEAMVIDYLRRAAELDAVPMMSVPVESGI